MDRDGLRRVAGFIHDLDLAGLDDEELEVALADLEELFPVAVALQLRAGQRPERAIWASSASGRRRHAGRAPASSEPPRRTIGIKSRRRKSRWMRRPWRSSPRRGADFLRADDLRVPAPRASRRYAAAGKQVTSSPPRTVDGSRRQMGGRPGTLAREPVAGRSDRRGSW